MTESLFGTPPAVNAPDNAEDTYSMSTRITFAVDGTITGVRFWGTPNPLTTVPLAAVYTTAGATVTTQAFGALVLSAWNTAMLAAPVAVLAGQTFDVGVGPRDRYAANTGTFAAPVVNGNLTGTAGRFIVSAASPPPFPTTSSTTWYGVDVLFEVAGVTGELDGVLPAMTGDLDGEATASGDLDAVLPGLTSDVDGEITGTGVLNATLPALIGDLVGLLPVQGVLNGVLPAMTADLTGTSAAGGATVGPCSWTIPDPLCCTEAWAATPAEVQSAARDYAAFILWAATGRQFGLCQIDVRPCGMRRCADGMGEFWGYDWSGGTWVPYIFDGQWFNCGCGAGCSCDPRCQVRLMGPVASIIEVTIGGIAVDPATYRVDDDHWLVRTAGECWPQCADMDTDDGDNVFVVTYQRGTAVPNALLRAAAMLACEWAKGCLNDETCRLSNRVTSVIRQGITIDMVNPEDLLESGLTGLWEVDTVIRATNPHRTVERLRIYAPELNVPRMTTWP